MQCRLVNSVALLVALLQSVLGENLTITAGETKIVGGVEATRNEFPWLIRIQHKSSKSIMCGGAIISNNAILTAAHCFYDTNSNEVEIVAGDHDASVIESTEQIKNIARVILHESYNTNNLQNDICILILSSNFTFGPGVSQIPIPQKGYSLPANTVVAGWGTVTEGASSVPRILQKVTVPIVTNPTCQQQYNSVSGGAITITSQMLCAGSANRDSCQGDSGGPLICDVGTGKVACGVVSFGVGCGNPNFSGVYTRVSEYGSWIAGKVNSTTTVDNGRNGGYQMLPNLFFVLVTVLYLVF